MYLRASRPDRFSPRALDSPHDGSPYGAGMVQALRRLVALALSLLLLPLGQAELFAQPAPPPQQGSSENDPYNRPYAPDQQSGPLDAEQLEQLVAPIALYPDTLVAQVLAASTYPTQVVEADRWRQAQGYASADQIAAGADAQTWDPSLKALVAFPQVLAEMDRNLEWTTDLGNAYYNQPQDILQAVQVMRQRAQAAGNLRSTPQETVSYDQGNIELAPVNPQEVYVPAYNPWGVYGEPVSPYPGFSLLDVLGSFFGSSPVRFGLGIAMTAFSHMSWGWLAWGLSWLAQSVLFHQSNYSSHSTTVADWGFPHRGLHAFSESGASARWPNSSRRTSGSFGWPGGGYHSTLDRGFVPRPPERSPGYGRFGGGYQATPGRGVGFQPADRYAGNRTGEGSGRPYQTRAAGYARWPSLEAYNHIQPPLGRSQQYGRPGSGTRPGSIYGSPPRSYRAPTAAFQGANFRAQSSRAFGGSDFAGYSRKPAHSGGFHLFGGRHSSENFQGGGHAPKSFRGGRNFSSRHSGGGGHSGGHSSGKHHR
jgi:hypothetical protein